MSERLVPYVTPQIRRRTFWAAAALSIGAVFLIRLLVEGNPISVTVVGVACYLTVLFGMHYWTHRWALRHATEHIPMAERSRRYLSEISFGEGVLLGAPSGILIALLTVDSLGELLDPMVAFLYGISGLAIGVVTMSLLRWTNPKPTPSAD